MRPYFALCAVLAMVLTANAQNFVFRFRHHPRPHPHPYPNESYDSGYTYAPLLTTPMMSFQTYSPNPVGASNATTGLAAGATDATASDLPVGPTDSDYTVAVWYRGGSPEITPEVNTWPISREGGFSPTPTMGYGMGEGHEAMEHAAHHEKRAEWLYFSGPEYTTDVASAAKGPGPGKHAYTNEDVSRQNDNNGNVKYDSKTEKIQ
ncbi:MAG: hypothetical protein ACRD3E_16815 [Terriglobales bacterium]